MNVKKAFKEQADPEENWLMFSLIKVKLKDGKFLCIWLIHKVLAFNSVIILLVYCFSKFFKMMVVIHFVESCAFKSTIYNPNKI